MKNICTCTYAQTCLVWSGHVYLFTLIKFCCIKQFLTVVKSFKSRFFINFFYSYFYEQLKKFNLREMSSKVGLRLLGATWNQYFFFTIMTISKHNFKLNCYCKWFLALKHIHRYASLYYRLQIGFF